MYQPTNAYFGQKDIQQALLLKRLCRDLLMSHPDEDHVHIIPTARDESDGLALSSRNAYLTSDGRKVAPTLHQALQAAQRAWQDGLTKKECVRTGITLVEDAKKQAISDGLAVDLRLDYLELNDAATFDVLDARQTKADSGLVILSGALYVDKTRLIDNILLDQTEK